MNHIFLFEIFKKNTQGERKATSFPGLFPAESRALGGETPWERGCERLFQNVH